MRDPSTGRRISRPNDPSEIQRVAAPHLRIISDETFRAAQKRKSERAHVNPGARKRAKRLLSGLLRCGCCGGGMSAASTGERTRIVCTGDVRASWRCEIAGITISMGSSVVSLMVYALSLGPARQSPISSKSTMPSARGVEGRQKAIQSILNIAWRSRNVI